MTPLRMTPLPLTISLCTPTDMAGLGRQWRALEARADGSFFLSWHWMSTWLAQSDAAPLLLTVRCAQQVVAMGLFHQRRLRRHGWLPLRALLLHQSGDPLEDALFLEYNGLLAERDFHDDALVALFEFLQDPHALLEWGVDCDEIHFGGVPLRYYDTARRMGLKTRLLDRKPTSAIDLRQTGANDALLSTLSSNTRQQVRRALRLYEARGPLRVESASDADTALAWLDALKSLHQALWISRGQAGAFANPFFERFHRALISQHLASGAVELLRISVGAQAIGYLYNFRQRGWVGNYASGFLYEDDARLKPGLVCLLLAAQWHAGRGAQSFDFMAGASRYKSSLANTESALCWFSLQRPSLKLRLEDALRAGAQILRRPAASNLPAQK